MEELASPARSRAAFCRDVIERALPKISEVDASIVVSWEEGRIELGRESRGAITAFPLLATGKPSIFSKRVAHAGAYIVLGGNLNMRALSIVINRAAILWREQAGQGANEPPSTTPSPRLDELSRAPGVIVSGVLDTWSIVRMHGGSGTISHGVIAKAPGCPAERHPTRDCACRVFRTHALAAAYVIEQEARPERPRDKEAIMATKAHLADPARDRFIDSASGDAATSFLCVTCPPPATTNSHIIVDDGFNRWQRCGECGELIFTTRPAEMATEPTSPQPAPTAGAERGVPAGPVTSGPKAWCHFDGTNADTFIPYDGKLTSRTTAAILATVNADRDQRGLPVLTELRGWPVTSLIVDAATEDGLRSYRHVGGSGAGHITILQTADGSPSTFFSTTSERSTTMDDDEGNPEFQGRDSDDYTSYYVDDGTGLAQPEDVGVLHQDDVAASERYNLLIEHELTTRRGVTFMDRATPRGGVQA